MAQVKARLLRPLNGQEIGTEVTYDEADAERLAAAGAIEIVAARKAEAKKAPAPANKKAPAPKNKGA